VVESSRSGGPVAGALAAAVGLGAAELVAGAIPTGRSPSSPSPIA